MGCLESKETKAKKAQLQEEIQQIDKELTKLDTPEEKSICAQQDLELQNIKKDLEPLESEAHAHTQKCTAGEGEKIIMGQGTWTFLPQYQPMLKISTGGTKLDLPLKYKIEGKVNKTQICNEAEQLNQKILVLCQKREEIFEHKKKAIDLQTRRMQATQQLKSME